MVKPYTMKDADEIVINGYQLREWKEMIIDDFKKGDKHYRMINYAYRRFKEAQEEMIKQNNIMESWFVRALKLEGKK